MMRDYLVRACVMNNEAVDLMESGLFELAQVLFAKSMRAAKTLIQEEENDGNQQCCAHNNIQGPEASGATSSASLESLFRASTIKNSRRGGDTTMASSRDGAPFVYQRAFKLRWDHGIPQLETGIAFHLNRDTPSSSHQEQAVNIYLLSLTTFPATDSAIVMVPPVLRVVILNNLGEIYFRLCQYDAMASAYADMLNLWRADTGPFLNHAERQGILCNAQFLKRPIIAAAA